MAEQASLIIVNFYVKVLCMPSKSSFLLVTRSKQFYFWQVLSGGKNNGEAKAYDDCWWV